LAIAGIAADIAELVSKICISIIYAVLAGADAACTVVAVADGVGVISFVTVFETAGVAFGVPA
jgi:hypothetical protein